MLDTGLRPAVENLALSRALIESRTTGEVGNTLRFFVSEAAAMIGCAHSAAQELDVLRCREEGIPIERTVGCAPARFVDKHQLGWELFALRSDLCRRDALGVAHRVGHAVCDALAALGVEARLRGECEIEVDGRLIGDVRVAREGAYVWCYGSLFIDFNAARAERVLRSALGRSAPSRPDAPAGFSMDDRVASLRELLGVAPTVRQLRRTLADAFQHALGVRCVHADLTGSELARMRIALREFSAPAWVGLIKRPGSEMPIVAASARLDQITLRAGVAYDLRGRRLREAWLVVDPDVLPARVLRDLESSIRGVALDSLASCVRRFFVAREVDLRGLRPADFSALVIRAVLHPERVLSG